MGSPTVRKNSTEFERELSGVARDCSDPLQWLGPLGGACRVSERKSRLHNARMENWQQVLVGRRNLWAARHVPCKMAGDAAAPGFGRASSLGLGVIIAFFEKP